MGPERSSSGREITKKMFEILNSEAAHLAAKKREPCQAERTACAKAQRHHVGPIQRLEGICLEASSEIRSCRDRWGHGTQGFGYQAGRGALGASARGAGEPWEWGRAGGSAGALCSRD